ncbi:MAG: glycosyltransferase involved in cell wall biosynthesis [Parasphingorhabdus sp.]|jgi:glycosyltransferase involved in cell wall biosynthesis
MLTNSISVVVPTFNRLKLLQRALTSIFSQTLLPSEVLVVDDGSDDGTSDWINQSNYDVRLLTQKNLGVSAARNLGIRNASSNWIALLDSDDEWLPEKLTKQVASLSEKSVLCHTDEIWVRNNVQVNAHNKHRKRGGFIFQHCLPLCAISPSSSLIKRSLFDEVGFFDESLPACEDYDLWLKICSRHPVDYIDQPLLVKYGGHDDQLSRKHWGMDRFRIQAMENLLMTAPLTDEQKNQTLMMMRKKLNVFLGGAKKRGNKEAVAKWTVKLNWVEDQLTHENGDGFEN